MPGRLVWPLEVTPGWRSQARSWPPALTKYFGIALIPLLLVYALAKERRVGAWLLHFLIPIAVLI
jgi:hypothetical protein